MSIDLKNNQLHIGTTGTSTAFLSESELPDCGRLTRLNEEEARLQSERMAEDRALAEALAASAKEGAGISGEGMWWDFTCLLFKIPLSEIIFFDVEGSIVFFAKFVYDDLYLIPPVH